MTGAEAGPILVLGANGQVGRATLAALKKISCPAVGLDRRRLDITDQEQVEVAFASVCPSVVINAAAYTAVDAAETDEEAAFAVNGRAPGVIAHAALAHGAAVIHLSTDYVFDGVKGAPYVEGDAVGPLSVYGESKLAGERTVLEAGAAGLVLRTSWLLAPEGGFVRAVLNRADGGEALSVVADQLGRPTIVTDLAETLATLAQLGQAERLPARTEIYHYAGSSEATWHDIAWELIDVWARQTGRRPPPLTAIASTAWKAPARRPADSRLDSTRFADDFGLSVRDWRGGVPDLVEEWLRGAHKK